MHTLIKLSTSTAPCKGILLESETLSFAEQGCSCPSKMTTCLLASENRSPKRASSSCPLADSTSFTPSPYLTMWLLACLMKCKESSKIVICHIARFLTYSVSTNKAYTSAQLLVVLAYLMKCKESSKIVICHIPRFLTYSVSRKQGIHLPAQLLVVTPNPQENLITSCPSWSVSTPLYLPPCTATFYLASSDKNNLLFSMGISLSNSNLPLLNFSLISKFLDLSGCLKFRLDECVPFGLQILRTLIEFC